MPKVTLYTSGTESLEGPENEPCWATLAQYDPHDPSSLRQAREAVRQQFSLNYLPVLCNEPEPSIMTEIFRYVRDAFRTLVRPRLHARHEAVTE